MLSSIDELLAIEEIKKLKARYFRFVDSHDWAGFRSCLADDAVFGPATLDPDAAKKWKEKSAPDLWTTPRIEGADAIVAWVREGLDPGTSIHRGFNAEIEILSADTARGIWGMEDIVRLPRFELHGYGYYIETYIRAAGGWRIKTFEINRKSMESRTLQITGDRVV